MDHPIVDTHPHVISRDTDRYPVDPVGGRRSAWSRERSVTVNELIGSMAEAEIDKAAIVQTSTVYGYDNAYILDAVAAYPDRFVAICAVDMRLKDAAKRIEALALRAEVGGIRLFTAGSNLPGQAYQLDDPSTYAAWRATEQLQIPVCVQMTEEAVPDLARLLKRFDGAIVVLDHAAKPTLASGPPYLEVGRLLELSEHRGVHMKITPHLIGRANTGKASPDTFFPMLKEAFGAERLLWGSNYPNHEGPLHRLLSESVAGLSSLSDHDHSWIFSRTALKLYPSLA